MQQYDGQKPPFGGGGYAPVSTAPPTYSESNFPIQPTHGGYPQPQPGGYVPPGYTPPPGVGFVPGQPMHGQPIPGPYTPPNQAVYPPGGIPMGAVSPPGQPITTQPGGGGNWMSAPQGLPNCPPGLEYLAQIDQLLVHQKVELLEAFTGFETNNKFTIKNSLGQKVFWAIEENDCCTRNCCGPARPFDMKILDAYKNQVIHLNRPLACQACCFPCCLQSMEVFAPPGTLIGRVEQDWSLCTPMFSLKNAAGETVLKIEGPLCTWTICGDVKFKLMTLDGTEVGQISKQWSGLARELFTDSDHFGITFPLDLDVRMKAVCLGACFLIDMMFFEKSGNKEGDAPGMFN